MGRCELFGAFVYWKVQRVVRSSTGVCYALKVVFEASCSQYSVSWIHHVHAEKQACILCVRRAPILCGPWMCMKTCGIPSLTSSSSWKSNHAHALLRCRLEGGELFSRIQNKALNGEVFDENGGRRGVVLTLPEARGVLRQVCAAVQFLHNLGIAHRDLKVCGCQLTIRAILLPPITCSVYCRGSRACCQQ